MLVQELIEQPVKAGKVPALHPHLMRIPAMIARDAWHKYIAELVCKRVNAPDQRSPQVQHRRHDLYVVGN